MTRARTDRRHRAREAALQILYQWEVGRNDVESAIETFFDVQWPEASPMSPPQRAFASGLARGTVAHLGTIDPLIAATAARWRPERMAVVDRLILRMAVAELVGDERTPPAVVMNEALELARTFGSEDSVKFINGVLDGICRKIAIG